MTLKRKYFKNWYSIPLVILFVISAIGFIITTIPSLDDDGSFFISTLLSSEFMRIISSMFFELGNSELFLVIIFAVFIIIESIFMYLKNKGKVQRTRAIIISLYLIIIVSWIALQIHLLLSFWSMPRGNWTTQISGLEIFHLIPVKMYFFIKLFIFTIEFPLLIAIAWFCRFKLSKNVYLLSDKYWLDSIKIILFHIIIYFITIILKQTTGRASLLNDSFYRIFGTVVQDSNGKYIDITLTDAIKETLQKYNINPETFKVDILKEINTYSMWRPSDFIPWYKINGDFFWNLQYWQPWSLFTNPNWDIQTPGFGAIDFPSGHVVSASSLISYIYFFTDKRKYSVSGKTATKLTFVWFGYVILMMLNLVIGREHWLSDVFFSGMLISIGIFLINRITNLVFISKLYKMVNKKGDGKTSYEIIEVKNTLDYYILINEEKYYLTTIKKGKKISKKFSKRYEIPRD